MRQSLTVALALLGSAALAFGALANGKPSSLRAGLIDPLLGLDHFLALLLVGMWAGRLRGPELWTLPAAFLAGTVPGFMLAVGQVSFPVVEALVHVLVVASLLLLAVALLSPVRLPMREAMSFVVLIGACHGYIHGVEVGSEQALWFGFGALISAAALLASGAAVGLASSRAS